MQYNISKAAKLRGVTKQAIYTAIRSDKLKAKKNGGKWVISEEDLIEYSENLYNRAKSKRNGTLLFDKSKGLYSVREAADYLGVFPNQIYYDLRCGYIKGTQSRSTWIINLEDLKRYSTQRPTKICC